MPGISNGAELVRKLAEDTGIGTNKLDCARDCLRAVKFEHGRVATGEEIAAALEARFGPTHVTVQKARALAETGVWTGPVRPEDVPIEEQMLADDDDADPDAAGKKKKKAAKPPTE